MLSSYTFFPTKDTENLSKQAKFYIQNAELFVIGSAN